MTTGDEPARGPGRVGQMTALGRMQNPARGILHGSAALVSAAGLVALVTRSSGSGMVAASVIYGLTLTTMYSTSALYHSIPWGPVWKLRFQKLDHAFIYALVASTFTALAVGVSRDQPWVIVGLAAIWTLFAVGVAKELVGARMRGKLLRFQFAVVAAVIPALWLVLGDLGIAPAVLTVAGGIAYLVGAWLFVNDRPRLAPRVFSHHEFFHVMVILASLAHFLAVWRITATG